jgi:hypothetical protein
MIISRNIVLVLPVLALSALACGASTPTETAPPVQATQEASPAVETATATRTAFPTIIPSPTTARLQLELIQSQVWLDRQGNARANVLFRNPYDFPVALNFNPRATLINRAGEFKRDGLLYFLDGISGGGGFILPGETIAANACFTCEEALLTEEWDSVKFVVNIVDATGSWDYSTKVEASAVSISFDGDSPIFDVSGTVKNNSGSALDRISVRIFVFDQEGNLIGAAEASTWDVGPDALVSFDGYGIGQTPDGPFEYEVTALGVIY